MWYRVRLTYTTLRLGFLSRTVLYNHRVRRGFTTTYRMVRFAFYGIAQVNLNDRPSGRVGFGFARVRFCFLVFVPRFFPIRPAKRHSIFQLLQFKSELSTSIFGLSLLCY